MITEIHYNSETKMFSGKVGASFVGGATTAGFATWGLTRLNNEEAQARISDRLMKKNPNMTAEEARKKAKKRKLARDIGLTATTSIGSGIISGVARSQFNKTHKK